MSNVEIKHCGPSANEGETLTANFLRHHLPSGKVLVNYYLPVYRGTREIDMVVINNNGVYLLEVKHWTGNIRADQETWQHRGENRANPVTTIKQRERQMHGFLTGRGWHNVSVIGLVVLSKGGRALEIDEGNPDARWVFGRNDSLIEALTEDKYVHSWCRGLSDAQVDRLCGDIFDSHISNTERQIHGYRILGQQERDHYVELIGEELELQEKVRIKQYDVPHVGSARELKRAVERFKRDIMALRNAGRHPHLVMPYRFRRDERTDERHYLILEWTGEQTLAERLAAGPIAQDEQLLILQDIVAALVHCHEQGVYHRNLSPASIYLTPTGRARVGDFDFAKVPAISRTLSTTHTSLLTGRHIAPEQMMDARDIDQRADIFSLGVIWYDMLFRPGKDDVVERDRIDHAPLPEDGREILSMMLAEARSKRVKSIAEVQEWLELLA